MNILKIVGLCVLIVAGIGALLWSVGLFNINVDVERE